MFMKKTSAKPAFLNPTGFLPQFLGRSKKAVPFGSLYKPFLSSSIKQKLSLSVQNVRMVGRY
jgi:hypothetical protein